LIKTKLKLGFGGTKLVFDALKYGDIDAFPEYTGTAFLVLLQKSCKQVSNFINPQTIFDNVKMDLKKLHNIVVLTLLGFNNAFALMMRKNQADSICINSISDLSEYLKSK
jgi:osmoprotectant transport system permease protein